MAKCWKIRRRGCVIEHINVTQTESDDIIAVCREKRRRREFSLDAICQNSV